MTATGEPVSVRLAYVILAHEAAEQVAAHAEMLLSVDPTGHVVIHYDLGSPEQEFRALQAAFADRERAHVVSDRVKSRWGMFGLVDGVVRALRTLRAHDVQCDYVYLLSVSCIPLRPIAALKRFLDQRQGMEFIEAKSWSWVVDGLREERYRYHHWFSFRTQRWLFDHSWKLQRMLRLERRAPKGLKFRLGSQWWCLTHKTCLAILDFIERRPRAYRFFRTTFIPDEMFFPTMVTSLVGPDRIFGRTLTFFQFSRKGRPLSFYDDHLNLVPQLPAFFARKVSPSAARLRRHLWSVAAAEDDGADLSAMLNAKPPLDHAERVARNVNFPRLGQMFYGDQVFRGWPSSLRTYHGVFAVLHGPPSIMRLVSTHLGTAPGVTPLGRVLHPDKVDLVAVGEEFRGFGADDARIRDLDRALYVGRLLLRCRGLPVIELAPGDDTHGEWFLHQDANVIFLPCMPWLATDPEWLRIYWMLVAADSLAAAPGQLQALRNVGSLSRVREQVDGHIRGLCTESHRGWVRDALLGPGASERLLPLRWGGGERAERMARGLFAKRAKRVEWAYGPAARPLLQGLAGIETRLAGAPDADMLAGLPSHWRYLAEQVAATAAGAHRPTRRSRLRAVESTGLPGGSAG